MAANIESYINNHALTQEMLDFLQRSVKIGISILFCTSHRDEAFAFVSALINSLEESLWFTVCYTSDEDVSANAENFMSSNIFNKLRLSDDDLENLTHSQIAGTPILASLTSQLGASYLQGLLQSQILAIIEAASAADALQKIVADICQKIPALTPDDVERWITDSLLLIVELTHDKNDHLRINLLDIGGREDNAKALSYLFRFSQESAEVGIFLKNIDHISFSAQLPDVMPNQSE